MPSSLLLACFHACKTEHGRQASERHGHTRAPGGLASDCKEDSAREASEGGERRKQGKEGKKRRGSKIDGRICVPLSM